jgi:glycosyltransferase involved in cell wall biosynthesis
VRSTIATVIEGIPDAVEKIYVVDDACPENTGRYVIDNSTDSRVKVLFHDQNRGVGGAVKTGYLAAIADGVDIVVKMDGDGQMDPAYLDNLIAPILAGQADYTKGNRFFDLQTLSSMPSIRLTGNAVLSFMNKLSTGYWDIFDPTNGYTAIHRSLISVIPWNKVSDRYFFESDLLFRLNTFRAVVKDVPMAARYGDENSSLRISRIVGEFIFKHKRNMFKRIFYNYFLRDFSVATLNLLLGLLLIFGGLIFGFYSWYISAVTGIPQTAGTVMLAALPILLGIQLMLAFLSYDILSTPRSPVQSYFDDPKQPTVP